MFSYFWLKKGRFESLILKTINQKWERDCDLPFLYNLRIINLKWERVWDLGDEALQIFIIKSMRAFWLVNQLWFIAPVNPWQFRLSSELLYKSNKPQVFMVYRLINHAGCWKNTRRIRKSRAAGRNLFPVQTTWCFLTKRFMGKL